MTEPKRDLPAAEAVTPQPQALTPDKGQGGNKKKKKDKVRAAWISFVGRIVAQFVGAAATISLGLMLVQKYQSPAHETENSAASGAGSRITRAATSVPGEKSLVVLPLQNFSSDPEQEYFADGMTEALIGDLAKLKGLRVISRTSSMYYKNQRKPLPEIARELNVDMVVEGSVVQSGGRVRITAQLIDARSDEHLWVQSYDRPLRDVLSLQTDVAAAIAREVNAAMSPSSSKPPAGRRATNSPPL